jgi:hypothetical protein
MTNVTPPIFNGAQNKKKVTLPSPTSAFEQFETTIGYESRLTKKDALLLEAMHELAEQAQQVCVYDCVFDGCGTRQQLKCLTVVDVAL